MKKMMLFEIFCLMTCNMLYADDSKTLMAVKKTVKKNDAESATFSSANNPWVLNDTIRLSLSKSVANDLDKDCFVRQLFGENNNESILPNDKDTPSAFKGPIEVHQSCLVCYDGDEKNKKTDCDTFLDTVVDEHNKMVYELMLNVKNKIYKPNTSQTKLYDRDKKYYLSEIQGLNGCFMGVFTNKNEFICALNDCEPKGCACTPEAGSDTIFYTDCFDFDFGNEFLNVYDAQTSFLYEWHDLQSYINVGDTIIRQYVSSGKNDVVMERRIPSEFGKECDQVDLLPMHAKSGTYINAPKENQTENPTKLMCFPNACNSGYCLKMNVELPENIEQYGQNMGECILGNRAPGSEFCKAHVDAREKILVKRRKLAAQKVHGGPCTLPEAKTGYSIPSAISTTGRYRYSDPAFEKAMITIFRLEGARCGQPSWDKSEATCYGLTSNNIAELRDKILAKRLTIAEAEDWVYKNWWKSNSVGIGKLPDYISGDVLRQRYASPGKELSRLRAVLGLSGGRNAVDDKLIKAVENYDNGDLREKYWDQYLIDRAGAHQQIIQRNRDVTFMNGCHVVPESPINVQNWRR